MAPAPRGRPRKGCRWDGDKWVSVVGVHVSVAQPYAAPRPLDSVDAHDTERFAREEEARLAHERAEEEDAAERERREKEAAAAEQERRRLDKPRQDAIWATTGLSSAVPVYYFDTFGTFQQLHHERPARPVRAPSRPYRLARRRILVRVNGPDAACGLERGEWAHQEREVVRRVYD